MPGHSNRISNLLKKKFISLINVVFSVVKETSKIDVVSHMESPIPRMSYRILKLNVRTGILSNTIKSPVFINASGTGDFYLNMINKNYNKIKAFIYSRFHLQTNISKPF